MALPGSSGKVAGGFGSFKSTEDQELVMILHHNAAGNRRGPVLRPAGLRVRRPLAPGSSGEESRELWAAPGESVALPGSSGKVTGGFGSFKSEELQELVMILHTTAAGDRRGPV